LNGTQGILVERIGPRHSIRSHSDLTLDCQVVLGPGRLGVDPGEGIAEAWEHL
jgi:hypothetical protein